MERRMLLKVGVVGAESFHLYGGVAQGYPADFASGYRAKTT